MSYSSEEIKNVIDRIILSKEEQEGNYMFYVAFLAGLHTFADLWNDLEDPETFIQFILFLQSSPRLIQDRILEELPELELFTSVRLSVSPELSNRDID